MAPTAPAFSRTARTARAARTAAVWALLGGLLTACGAAGAHAGGRTPGAGGGGTPSRTVAAFPAADGWHDMTRGFGDYFDRHHRASDRLMPAGSIKDVRVRATARAAEARISFTTRSVGKGYAEDAREVARLFGEWRRTVHGDSGVLLLYSPHRPEPFEASW
ncbi:hypothetical protein ABT143_07205 [Streptomyces sp. NPDC002033]|uniref:hypothetical protein n=2 Tax=Streptomyces TaxID=1883 RepID=UPI003325120D